MKLSALLTLAIATNLAAGCSPNSENIQSTDGQEIAAPPMGPDPDQRPEKLQGWHTHYPIVLEHGFSSYPRGFVMIATVLEADGHSVHVSSVAPYGTVSERANEMKTYVDAALQEQIDQGETEPKVNIIAHSMGGLDARELISILGYGDRVASVTMISTPNQGSPVADAVLGRLPGDDHLANEFATLIADNISSPDLAAQTDLSATLQALAEANAPDFNASHPNDGRVYYQSWGGVSEVLGIRNENDYLACASSAQGLLGTRADILSLDLAGFASVTGHHDQKSPNDGLVPVASAIWGNFQGCIPIDHTHEVGKDDADTPIRHTGFDRARFYRNIAFDLVDLGF